MITVSEHNVTSNLAMSRDTNAGSLFNQPDFWESIKKRDQKIYGFIASARREHRQTPYIKSDCEYALLRALSNTQGHQWATQNYEWLSPFIEELGAGVGTATIVLDYPRVSVETVGFISRTLNFLLNLEEEADEESSFDFMKACGDVLSRIESIKAVRRIMVLWGEDKAVRMWTVVDDFDIQNRKAIYALEAEIIDCVSKYGYEMDFQTVPLAVLDEIPDAGFELIYTSD